MKKISVILLFAACMTLNAQKGKYLMCHWRQTAVDEARIDNTDYTLFKKGKIWYCLSNDRENLYIDVRIDDSGVQNKILNEGMMVWFNPEGKNIKRIGIHYPIGARAIKGPRNVVVSGSLLSMANTIELIGFSDKPVHLPYDNKDNIRGSVRYDSEGSLLYTMLVPIEKLPLREEGAGLRKLPFSLAIEYGMAEMSGRPAGGSMPSMPSGMPPGGGRGGGGGGRSGGGGMPPGGSAPRGAPAAAPQPVILWVKNIMLASE